MAMIHRDITRRKPGIGTANLINARVINGKKQMIVFIVQAENTSTPLTFLKNRRIIWLSPCDW
jgi:hypothetical protein